MQTCFKSNDLAISYDHYQFHKNSPAKDRQGLELKNFADYKPKYFNRPYSNGYPPQVNLYAQPNQKNYKPDTNLIIFQMNYHPNFLVKIS